MVVMSTWSNALGSFFRASRLAGAYTELRCHRVRLREFGPSASAYGDSQLLRSETGKYCVRYCRQSRAVGCCDCRCMLTMRCELSVHLLRRPRPQASVSASE